MHAIIADVAANYVRFNCIVLPLTCVLKHILVQPSSGSIGFRKAGLFDETNSSEAQEDLRFLTDTSLLTWAGGRMELERVHEAVPFG
jgi:hypothetical protein